MGEWRTAREASKELVQLALEKGQGNGKGIMHGFLDDTSLTISEDQAIEMNLILTFAAADTTSSLVNSVLTNVSKHADIQEKVYSELKRELGRQDYHRDAKLTYFGQLLKESQRLTPPLPW